MPRKSAGLLIYRNQESTPEVFLVHMGGPFWAKKDEHAWSIPKGEFAAGEEPLLVAMREFKEETGQEIRGEFQPLMPVKQSGGKEVHAWALEANPDAENITSNFFQMEWPPKSGKMQEFPEVDKACWFDLETARNKIVKAQTGFLDQLKELFRTRKQDV